MDVIYVLWLRQVKRYVAFRPDHRVAWPAPVVFAWSRLRHGAVFQKAGQGNYIQFLAPGVIAMTVLFTSVFSGIELIWDRQFGFLKETLVAPVSRLTIMVGRVLGRSDGRRLPGPDPVGDLPRSRFPVSKSRGGAHCPAHHGIDCRPVHGPWNGDRVADAPISRAFSS